MSCLYMIVGHLGDNDYNIPLMNKAKMEQEGTLPMVPYVMDAAEPLMEMKEMTDSMDKAEIDNMDDKLENTNLEQYSLKIKEYPGDPHF